MVAEATKCDGSLTRTTEKAGTAAAAIGAASGVVGDALTGEIVVLAVPYPALAEPAKTYGDQLANKVVVDITNPVDFATFDGLVVPADSSAAAELAAAVPGAKVIKAFNTTSPQPLRQARSVANRLSRSWRETTTQPRSCLPT